MRLGLGTVQFGMDYGVSNLVGQTPPGEVAAILARAHAAGIRVLDTAAAYGNAEQILGETGLLAGFDIVTKTPALATVSTAERADTVERTLLRSLELLGVDSVHGLLLHSAADLAAEGGEEVARRLVSLREQGLARRIGVSVYSRADLDRASSVLTPDLVQLPMSVYDQRLIADGTIAQLAARGIEVHTRSALLQGVLAMPPDRIPSHLASLRAHHAGYLDFIESAGHSHVEAALGFALGVPGPTAVVVGVNTLAHLEELLLVESLDPAPFARWALDDPELIDPSRWEKS